MNNQTLFVRHLEDENDLLNHGQDNPLKPGQEETIVEIADEITSHTQESGAEEIVIVTSAKLRSYLTGKEVARAILTKPNRLPVFLFPDARINELGQGSFILPDGYKPNDYFDPLMKAWDAYFYEVFTEKNTNYRFGDPALVNGVAKYPLIVGAFSEFGENHRELSIRFYEFILDSLKPSETGKMPFPVVITHQATASRIQQLKYLSGLDRTFVNEVYTPGKLCFLEWEARANIKVFTNNFKRYGGYYLSDISNLYGFQDIIHLELEHLKNNEQI